MLSATSLNTNCDSNRKFREMKWKSEARLADRGGQKGFERTTTPLGRPRAITISQSSFRSFNTNIGYQAEAARVVSSQSVCRDKSIPSDKADKLTKQKGQDTEQKETNTYSTATDSGMHVTPSVPNSEASLIQRHHYKKKLPNKDDTARIKRRRNHNKPKSESGNEMALLHKSFRPSESNSKSKEIHTDEGFGIEICRPLSVSQQSLQYYKDDDSVFNADVGTADSRSHPLGKCSILFSFHDQ